MAAEQTVFNCPVCLSLFDTPKILPDCGHVMCLPCLRQIVRISGDKGSVACPECRTKSKLPNFGDPASFKTDIAILRAVDYLKSLKQPSQNEGRNGSSLIGDKCNHAVLFRTPLKCSHCEREFCEACFLKHLELLRIESNWLGFEIEKRLENAKLSQECVLKQAEAGFEEQKNKSATVIVATSEMLEKVAIESIRQNRKHSIEKINQLADEGLAKVRRIVKDAVEVGSDGTHLAVTKALAEVNGKSLIYCKPDEIVRVHKAIVDLDVKATMFENLSNASACDVSVSNTQDKVLAVMEHLNGFDISDFVVLTGGYEKRIQTISQASRYHEAAKTGNLALIKKIFEQNGRQSSCTCFIVEHRDPNDADKTALIQAAEAGHLPVVRFLVSEHSANVHGRSLNSGRMAIHLAALNRRFDIVRFLCDHSPDLVEAENAYQETPLFFAAMSGSLKIVKFLVNVKHANLNHCSKIQDTPLFYAHDLEILRFLLGKGANLEAKRETDDDEIFLIHEASSLNRLEMVKHLLTLKPDWTGLATVKKRWTPLHFASQSGVEVAEFLVTEGKVEIDPRNLDLRTPLMLAVMKGNERCTRFLVEKGADILTCDRTGQASIHMACENDSPANLEIVRFLVERNLDQGKLHSASGMTPLDVAKLKKCWAIAAFLREKFGEEEQEQSEHSVDSDRDEIDEMGSSFHSSDSEEGDY